MKATKTPRIYFSVNLELIGYRKYQTPPKAWNAKKDPPN